MGQFKRDSNGKPILFPFPDGFMHDDNGAICTDRGYLMDEEGNFVDRNEQVMFEKHLLTENGCLPKLFKNS